MNKQQVAINKNTEVVAENWGRALIRANGQSYFTKQVSAESLWSDKLLPFDATCIPVTAEQATVLQTEMWGDREDATPLCDKFSALV